MAAPATATTEQPTATGSVTGQRMRAIIQTEYGTADVLRVAEIARRAKQIGVGFLPTRQFVCFQRECPAIIGHTIAWMDNSHLTVAYSTQIADPFRAAFLDVVAGGGRLS